MNPKQLKIIGYVAIVVMVLNVFLFAFTVISPAIFWIVILLGAIFVYKVLPKMKR
jgi:hypothetical protein